MNLESIRTVHDVLPKFGLKKLQQTLLSPSFPWFFIPNTAYFEVSKSNVINDCNRPMANGWSHTVYEEGQILGSHIHLLELALMEAAEKANIPVSKIIRIRIGLILSNEISYRLNGAHVDYTEPHTTALFYLNNSDGDTILYNEMYDMNYRTIDEVEDKSREYYNSVLKNAGTIDTTITPEENKFVFFNGLKYHSSSTPLKNNYRIVVNYNFI